MKSTFKSSLTIAGLAFAMMGTGCSSLSEREKSTAIGQDGSGDTADTRTDGQAEDRIDQGIGDPSLHDPGQPGE